jgi:hypothetical protein
MQFGTSTIFLLLSAKNIQDFVLAYFGRYISFCSIALMVAVLLFPITLFKSPQDFWLVY